MLGAVQERGLDTAPFVFGYYHEIDRSKGRSIFLSIDNNDTLYNTDLYSVFN